MPRTARTSTEESAGTAINEVLNAEVQAGRSIAAAQAEALRLIENANLQARHIHDRTDRRAAKLRAACQRRTAARTAVLKAEAEAALQCPVMDDARREHLMDAVAQLAVELTGGAP
jgi:vacuolar-type H+-ATPase subunit H